MALGKVIGKSSTNEFQFLIESDAVRKMQYVMVGYDGRDILAVVDEIEKRDDRAVAYCSFVGYREGGVLRNIKSAVEPGSEIFDAPDELVKGVLGLEESKDDIFIGKLDGRDINVYLNINKLLTRHIAILAKSGAGKCVAPNTKVTLKDGSRVEIGNFVDEKLKQNPKRKKDVEFVENNDVSIQVASLNENKISHSQVKAFMRRKAPEFIYSVSTRSGQELSLTSEHLVPVMRYGVIQWVPAFKLIKDDYLLIPKVRVEGSKQRIDLIDIWKDSNNVRMDDKGIIEEIRSKINGKKISIVSLSKELGFSISAIRKWFGKSGVPLGQLDRLSVILGMDFNEVKKKIKFIRWRGTILPSSIELSEDFAKLMGYMLAEGHNNCKAISFTNFSEEIQRDYSMLVGKVFGLETSAIARKGVLMIYNSFLAKTLEKIGFTNSSWTKFIPEQVIKSKKPILYSFLSSFIDCDGHVSSKSSSLEICLASDKIIDCLKFIFIRLGVIPRHSKKLIKGKSYGRLAIMGSSYLSLLGQNLELLLPHKKERLIGGGKLKSNTNLDVIPNLGLTLKQIRRLLRMSNSMIGATMINTCINKRGNPSYSSLRVMLKNFDERYDSLRGSIEEIQDLFSGLPLVNENYALDVLRKIYNRGLSFCEIAKDTGVSSTTVRRMVRGITMPTGNVYELAGNNCSDPHIDVVLSLDLMSISRKIELLCENIGYQKKKLYQSLGYYKQLLYGYRIKDTVPLYSTLYMLSRKLFEISKDLSKDIERAKEKIDYLGWILDLGLFFDQVKSIKKVKTNFKYVYDLETEDHNFVANNLLIHNSYTLGVFLEELMEKKVPIVVIDPHGEYSSLKHPNPDKEGMGGFSVVPKGYGEQVEEFSPDVEANPEAKPFRLSNKDLGSSELIHLLPVKMSNMQMGVFYSALNNLEGRIDLDRLIVELSNEENSAKWSLINVIEYVKKLDLFSDNCTRMSEIVRPGKMSILNLKGVSPEIQEVVVYKLAKDLFEERKRGNIPPFFLVVEEGHNFIPERSYGEAKSSGVLRQIFAEGRKFGLGVCIVSQRPSRVEKNALSQVNTQVILNISNPGDVKAVVNSVEGINSNSEKEIKNLSVGSAMVAGVVDVPILVNIRPRRSKHGGEAVRIFDADGDMLPLIKPNVSLADMKVLGDVKVKLVPCAYLSLKGKDDFNLLFNLSNGNIIADLGESDGEKFDMPDLKVLSPMQERVFLIGFKLGSFKPAEIFSKAGVQFSDVYDTITSLEKKGFFVKDGNSYSVKFDGLMKVYSKGVYSKVEFGRVDYDKIVEKKFDAEKFADVLERFFTVKNFKECFLVSYVNNEQ